MSFDPAFTGRFLPFHTPRQSVLLAGLLAFLVSCAPTSSDASEASERVVAPGPSQPGAGAFVLVHAPDYAPQGHEGGEFEPAFQTWVLQNVTDDVACWRAEVDEPWLSITGPCEGDLEPGQTTEVHVAIDDYIASLQVVGKHSAVLCFIDRDEEVIVDSDVITMTVTSAPPLVGGWTFLRPSVDARTVFVSAQGSDLNSGLSQSEPKRTIAAGKALVRDGEGDWLLLRRGDVFFESLGQWKTSGASELDMQVVTGYGDQGGRPMLLTGSGPGVVTHGGGGSPPSIDHVAFVGLHFEAHTHTGVGQPTGLALHQPSTNVLIEDCYFGRYNTGLVIQGIGGRHTDIRLRRSVVVDSFGVMDGNPQGIYAVNTDGLLIEDCVFDTNGWNPIVAGAGADIFSHNLYIDTDTSGVIVRGNIVANGASHGIQMRSGGLCVNNLLVRNSIGLMMAGNHGPQQENARAVLNVITDGKNIDVLNPRGWGIDFNNVVGGVIRKNLIVNNGAGNAPISIILGGGGFGDGVHDVEVQGNVVYDWGGALQLTGDSTQLTNVVLRSNDLQNSVNGEFLVSHFSLTNFDSVSSGDNRFFNQQVPLGSWMLQPGNPQSVAEWKADVGDTTSVVKRVLYVDPTRDVARYNASLGGAPTHEAFMHEARLQARGNWRRGYTAKAVNAWMRAGFEE